MLVTLEKQQNIVRLNYRELKNAFINILCI